MAIEYNLTIDQNTNWQYQLQIQTLTNPALPWNSSTNPYIPVNIAGYTFEMNVAPDYATTPIITASSGNGKITITNGAGGLAQITLIPSDTATINFGTNAQSSTYEGVYDVYQTDNIGNDTRLYYGTFIINREVA
jgi:hypothetical protein